MSRRFVRSVQSLAALYHRHPERSASVEVREARLAMRPSRLAYDSRLAMTTSALRRSHHGLHPQGHPDQRHPDDVWAAVRDFGAVHRRLAPGFVLDARLDGDARIVTFANGTVARELLVDCDDTRRRLVYAMVSERVKHYNASVQVFADGEAQPADLDRRRACPTRSRPISTARWTRPRCAMQKALARTPQLSGCHGTCPPCKSQDPSMAAFEICLARRAHQDNAGRTAARRRLRSPSRQHHAEPTACRAPPSRPPPA